MIAGATSASCCVVTSPSEPIVQMTKLFNASSALRYCRICTMALTPELAIIPKISITIISFILWLTAATTANIAAAPIHAAPATPTVESHADEDIPSRGAPRIKSATPRLAPELTPKTYGPANGLRNRVCICKPLTESAAPARIATTAFIRRMSMMILRVMGSHSPPVSAAHTSPAAMPTEPTIISAAKSTTTSVASTAKSIFERLLILSFAYILVYGLYYGLASGFVMRGLALL